MTEATLLEDMEMLSQEMRSLDTPEERIKALAEYRDAEMALECHRHFSVGRG